MTDLFNFFADFTILNGINSKSLAPNAGPLPHLTMIIILFFFFN